MPTNDEVYVGTDRHAGVIPEGIHEAVIVDYEQREGPSAPYWNFTLQLVDSSPFAGQKVWAMVSTSPSARWKMEEFLDAMRVPEGTRVSGSQFIGKACRIKIFHEEYDGRVRAKVENWLSVAAKSTPATFGSAKPAARVATPAATTEAVKEEEEATPDESGDDTAPVATPTRNKKIIPF